MSIVAIIELQELVLDIFNSTDFLDYLRRNEMFKYLGPLLVFFYKTNNTQNGTISELTTAQWL